MPNQSSRLLLERMGIYRTFRLPMATVSPNDHPVHRLALSPPLPSPVTVFNGDPPPDRGQTPEPWPHGEVCEES